MTYGQMGFMHTSECSFLQSAYSVVIKSYLCKAYLGRVTFAKVNGITGTQICTPYEERSALSFLLTGYLQNGMMKN